MSANGNGTIFQPWHEPCVQKVKERSLYPQVQEDFRKKTGLVTLDQYAEMHFHLKNNNHFDTCIKTRNCACAVGKIQLFQFNEKHNRGESEKQEIKLVWPYGKCKHTKYQTDTKKSYNKKHVGAEFPTCPHCTVLCLRLVQLWVSYFTNFSPFACHNQIFASNYS